MSKKDEQGTPPPRALAGIRVLDLGRVLAAPWTTQMLGDLGADVIKVERPGPGDESRQSGPVWLKGADGKKTPESALYIAGNRNKRSITVNLTSPDGQKIIRDLAAQCDVLVENYKVGDLKRYSLDYDSLKKMNPRLIYCSITGYGQSGPYSLRPGYDAVFQAEGGLMSVSGIPDGEPGAGPMKIGPSIVDVLTGYNAVIGIQAALRHREQSGEGQYIDLSLLDVTITSMSSIVSQYLIEGFVQPRRGDEGNGGGPSQLVDCADGKIYISCGNTGHFERVCELIGHPELAKDPRFTTGPLRSDNRKILRPLMYTLYEPWKQRKKADVLRELHAADIPSGAVNNLAEVFEDPHVKHRDVTVTMDHPVSGKLRMMANPIRMSATPPAYDRPPPRIGEHTDEVLREVLGMDAAGIARLREGGAV